MITFKFCINLKFINHHSILFDEKRDWKILFEILTLETNLKLSNYFENYGRDLLP